MTEQTCGTCRYGMADELADYICVNNNSERCGDWVGDDDSCEEWEREYDE